MLAALAYATARDTLSAAVRLHLVGPMRAVGIQAEIGRAIAEMRVGTVEDAASAAPLVEAASLGHGLLEMRLFLS